MMAMVRNIVAALYAPFIVDDSLLLQCKFSRIHSLQYEQLKQGRKGECCYRQGKGRGTGRRVMSDNSVYNGRGGGTL